MDPLFHGFELGVRVVSERLRRSPDATGSGLRRDTPLASPMGRRRPERVGQVAVDTLSFHCVHWGGAGSIPTRIQGAPVVGGCTGVASTIFSSS